MVVGGELARVEKAVINGLGQVEKAVAPPPTLFTITTITTSLTAIFTTVFTHTLYLIVLVVHGLVMSWQKAEIEQLIAWMEENPEDPRGKQSRWYKDVND